MTTMIQDERLQELRQWIDQGHLPEVAPTRQERSLRSALAMVDAGREIIRKSTFADLSVEAVCDMAGVTVGSFYCRFQSKESFFITLQRLQTFRSQAKLAEVIRRHGSSNSNVDDLVEDMVSLLVSQFRENVGMMRASLQRTKEGMWQVIKASGDRHRTEFANAMVPLLPLPEATARMRALFAFQALAGVLVHAVLNNPGPLDLEHESLIPELNRLLKSYLFPGSRH